MPDVFELTTASARRCVSTCASSSRLASSRSTTASTIQSHLASRGRSASNPPVATRRAVARVKKGSGFSARARSSPAAAVRASRSSSSTGTPAFARCAAICAPMVPAPSTAADRNCVICDASPARVRAAARAVQKKGGGPDPRTLLNRCGAASGQGRERRRRLRPLLGVRVQLDDPPEVLLGPFEVALVERH